MGLDSNKIELGSDKIELGSDKLEHENTKIELGSGRFKQNRRDATSYRIYYIDRNKITHRMLKQKTMKKTNSR